MATTMKFSRAPWRKRRSAENKLRHAAQARRAPGWDVTLPPVVFSITEAAKRLGLRRNELFAWLEANGWICWNPDTQTWAARDTAVELGWMATRRKTVGWSSYVYQAVITPAGLGELGIRAPGERADGRQR